MNVTVIIAAIQAAQALVSQRMAEARLAHAEGEISDEELQRIIAIWTEGMAEWNSAVAKAKARLGL